MRDRSRPVVLASLGWPATGDRLEAAIRSDAHPRRAPAQPGLGWPGSKRPADSVGTEAFDDAPVVAPVVSRGTGPGEAPTPGETPLPADDTGTAGPDPSTPLARTIEHEVRLVREQSDGPLPVPDRTRVLAIANQKGGVGKTTTAVNIAAALAQGGQRVLLVDLDPQGNASTALAIEHSEGTPGVYEVLVHGTPIHDVVQRCEALDDLHVLPASIDLAGAEIDLVSLVARESRLRRALTAYLRAEDEAARRYDFVFVDCPPSLGLLTVNALVAGEEVLIPIQCEYYALEGVGQLLRTVDMVRAHLNADLTVSTIVLTMHDSRTRLAAGVADEVRTHFPRQVLRTAIPRSVRISEAPSYQQTVMTYDAASAGALSYREAAREIAVRGPTAGLGPETVGRGRGGVS